MDKTHTLKDKVTSCKINILKSVTFIYTKSNQLEDVMVIKIRAEINKIYYKNIYKRLVK